MSGQSASSSRPSLAATGDLRRVRRLMRCAHRRTSAQSADHLRTVGRPPPSAAQHRMSGTVETELRKLEKIVPGLDKDKEEMEMVSRCDVVYFGGWS